MALIGVLAYQFVFYLRYGVWREMGWDDLGWPVLQTNWIGIQRIIDWIADTHIGLLTLILAVVILVITQVIAGALSTRAWDIEQQLEQLKREIQ